MELETVARVDTHTPICLGAISNGIIGNIKIIENIKRTEYLKICNSVFR